MKDGDFINVEFTGRVKGTDEVFDTTNEEMAKSVGIHNPKTNYGHIPIIIGAGQTIPGLEEALKEMNVGDKKKVVINPDKAFGEKNPELVRLLPMSLFKENRLEPEPGRTVNFNGLQGKILTIDGGRVKVDFNHPLAGKTIEYEVEIKDEIKEPDQRVKAVVRYFTGMKHDDYNVAISGNEASVSVQKADLPKQAKQNIADTIMKWVGGITRVSFVDIFEKKN